MSKPPFLIPVENQVRELDAKLLLACVAADRGHTSYIGYKGAIDGHINKFPPGIYFAKSVTERSVKILTISHRLGHRNVAWDEEAVVHYPPEIYYKRRLCETALRATDQLLAWGDDNKTLFESYDGFPGTPIQVVGNPRIDLLRPEFREFYDAEVEAIGAKYGRFILFNTNFGSVNGFYPELNVCYEKASAPGELTLGRSAIGLSREYAMDLYAFRKNNFDTMKELVLEVAHRFPDETIVVRPHPSEDHDTWRKLAAPHNNISVDAQGNVVPWLLAAGVLIHNACTTAVESYVLGKPAIAYVPAEGAGVYGSDLPNQMSHISTTPQEAIALISQAMSGDGLAAQDDARSSHLEKFLAALHDSFASERIVESIDNQVPARRISLVRRSAANLQAAQRRFNKWLQTRKDSGRYGLAFKKQRFPDLSTSVLQDKASRLSRLAGLTAPPRISEVRTDIFSVERTG